MIVTVTMNPAIDKTVELPSFVYGGLNRIENIILDAGGKGINVSKTIKELGGDTIATGFVGGNNGKVFCELLENAGLHTDFVEISGETRINTKLAESGGTLTELNEKGPVISSEEQEKLLTKLMQYASNETWFVLSGSVPAGVPKTIYRDIIEAVHARGAKVFLDADGELFAYALEANPDVIKPNRVELEKFVHAEHALTEQELLQVGKRLLQQGLEKVIISLGEEGALFLTKEQVLKCPAISVEVRSTVGAGDAMVAAFTYGMSQGKSLEECAKLSVAASAGAVSTEGTKPAALSYVNQLLKSLA